MAGALARCIPPSAPASSTVIAELNRILTNVDKLLVLTGAGISTESGIPDYRSKIQGRTVPQPIQHHEFMGSEYWRKRYWARNYAAWPTFSSAPVNETHKCIAKWEKSEKFHWLITQNVDGLHTAAGSTRVSELHGCGRRAKCMQCRKVYPRSEVQRWMDELNEEGLSATSTDEMRPDGDVGLSEDIVESFKTPSCPECGPGSILKTDVVLRFFGDNIPRAVFSECNEKMKGADGILVLGSSLVVMSGFRFVQDAYLRDLPIIIVNIGPTRGDNLATLKVDAKCSEVVSVVEL